MSELGNKELNEAIKIYAACSLLNFSDQKTRLFSYIHMMCLSNELGSKQFSQDQSEAIAAIGYLLGQVDFKDLIKTMSEDDTSDEQREDIMHLIEDRLKKQRTELEEKELHELIDRLKLYSDRKFRQEQISTYQNTILPKAETLSLEEAKSILDESHQGQ